MARFFNAPEVAQALLMKPFPNHENLGLTCKVPTVPGSLPEIFAGSLPEIFRNLPGPSRWHTAAISAESFRKGKASFPYRLGFGSRLVSKRLDFLTDWGLGAVW